MTERQQVQVKFYKDNDFNNICETVTGTMTTFTIMITTTLLTTVTTLWSHLYDVYVWFFLQAEISKAELEEALGLLNKDIDKLEDIGNKAKVLRNKGQWLDSDLNVFLENFLKQMWKRNYGTVMWSDFCALQLIIIVLLLGMNRHLDVSSSYLSSLFFVFSLAADSIIWC